MCRIRCSIVYLSQTRSTLTSKLFMLPPPLDCAETFAEEAFNVHSLLSPNSCEKISGPDRKGARCAGTAAADGEKSAGCGPLHLRLGCVLRTPSQAAIKPLPPSLRRAPKYRSCCGRCTSNVYAGARSESELQRRHQESGCSQQEAAAYLPA